MAIEESHYIASKTIYAINWDTFKITEHDREGYKSASAAVDAVWTVRKHGEVQISKGTLHHSFAINRTPAEFPSMENFIENFDTRYGGTAVARWDGDYMWAPDTTLADMNALAAELDPMLENIPNVPEGYSGWYRLVARFSR